MSPTPIVAPDKPPVIRLPVRDEFEIFVVELPDGRLQVLRREDLPGLPVGAVVVSGARRV